ncbi:hypothetical protein BGZ91_010239 [Linnemannia elongata]|nr:hypothetical protein BGZ91_010239 [Linnemannia elongata]
MATLFRISNSARLSLITDALSRLRLHQHTGPAIVPRLYSFQQRTFTQSLLCSLKNLAASDPTTVPSLDASPSKPAGSKKSSFEITQKPLHAHTLGTKVKPRFTPRLRPSLRWTDEEDRELFRLVMAGTSTYDIYSNHFRDRTLSAVSRRVFSARLAGRALEQQAREGVRPGELDVAKSVAGEEGAAPLRTVYSRQRESQLVEQQESGMSDNVILRRVSNATSAAQRGAWTRDEDELLRELVRKYIHLPEPAIWTSVSGGSVNASVLLRGATTCRQRWRVLQLASSAEHGPWTREEELRLQEAISEQLEGKYQVVVDVLIGKPPGTEHNLSQWRSDLQQLPAQAGLPILKFGSRRLRMLSWIAVERIVKSRSDIECRNHFYEVYHNGNRGLFSKEERKRLKEGLEMFEKDYWKIAEHVGTRSPIQVMKAIRGRERYKERKLNVSKESSDNKK